MEKPKVVPIIIERQKMPRDTWVSLRSHIMRERQEQKKEEEKNEQFEKKKKEMEKRKKQEASSLEMTKEQIGDLEEKLSSLKKEKHQLFLTLKKVLNEDETRRRKDNSREEVNNSPLGLVRNDNNIVVPGVGHHQMYMQPTTSRHLPVSSSASAAVKRPHSPSSAPPISSPYFLPSPRTLPSPLYPALPTSAHMQYSLPLINSRSITQTVAANNRFVSSLHHQMELANRKTGFSSDRDLPLALTPSSRVGGYPHREALSITGYPRLEAPPLGPAGGAYDVRGLAPEMGGAGSARSREAGSEFGGGFQLPPGYAQAFQNMK